MLEEDTTQRGKGTNDSVETGWIDPRELWCSGLPWLPDPAILHYRFSSQDKIEKESMTPKGVTDVSETRVMTFSFH
jgi:hypothetical protein